MARCARLVALLLVATSAALATTLVTTGTTRTSADPFYCLVVHDAEGRPINTTCVPDPTGG